MVDRTTQGVLLRDATILCSTYPVLFNEKVLACVRQKNNLSPSTGSASSATAAGASGTGTIVTSFDEETTTTTTPTATVFKPTARVREKDRDQDTNRLTNGTTTPTTTLSSTTTVSGGVTIVKLNVGPSPIIQSNQVDSTVNGTGIERERVIEPKENKSIGPTVVSSTTITNSINGATSPPHTG